MNAINFLLKEHEKVRVLLADIGSSSHRMETKKKLFDQLAKELLRHETMEHKIWYPKFKNDSRIDATVRHLLSEEKHAEKAIHRLNELQDDAQWEKQFNQFKREVEQHAQEEETKLFPRIKSILDEHALESIGKEMLQFKQQNAMSA